MSSMSEHCRINDMQSHIGDKLITNNGYIGALSTEWTYTNQPSVWLHFLALGRWDLGFICPEWRGILSVQHMATQLRNTVVRGCPLAAIMILDYGYTTHIYPRYTYHLCMYESSGPQRALQRGFMLVTRSVGTSFTPGYSAGHVW